MLAAAFLMRNLATGLTFSAFAVLYKPLSEELLGNTVMLSASLSIVALTTALCGPAAGALVDRWSIRGSILGGCLLFATGFALTARVESVTGFLLAFGVLGGMGASFAGMLVANKIATRHFPHSAGLACGLANLPVAAALLPPLFAFLIANIGWRALLNGFATVYLLMLVVIVAITPLVHASSTPRAKNEPHPEPLKPPKERFTPPFRTAVFWIVSLAVGLMLTNNLVLTTHIVNHATTLGVPYTQASFFISLLGLSSMIGTFGFGWLCDRLAPAVALMLATGLMALLWVVLVNARDFVPMAVAIAGLGACTSAVIPGMSALAHRIFPADQFATASGQLGLAVLPFLAFSAPLAGWFFQIDENYDTAFSFQMAFSLAALLVLWFGRARLRGGQT